MNVRDAKAGDRFRYGNGWWNVTFVDGKGFEAFDGFVHAEFTFEELESPDQWRTVHLCNEDCLLRGYES